MPVKVLDSGGNGSMFQAAQGIDWAVQHGAQVINMSFGGASADAGLQTAVNNAWNAGVVLVAAAGTDNHGPVLYPAAFSNVVAVGSLDVNGDLSSFSNVGPQIDVMAPGEEIASTLCTCHGYTGGYATGDGTSFASPEVAGIAALMIAAGTTNNATIVSRLASTAVNLEAAGFDNDTGWGRVNAAGAVGADTTPPTVSITSPAAGATVSGTVSITASARDNAAVQKVQLWVDGTYLGYDTSAPYTKTWNAAGKNGRHTVIARAVDWANNRSTTSISITVSNADSTPPTVSITAPADDATVTGVVTIAANASDAGGVQKVQFWAGSTYLGYDTAAPYTRTWDVTSLPFGVYAIEARAVDWRGNTTDAVVNVRVGNDVSAPSVTLTAPGDGASVSGTVSIQASASDDVQVEKVRIWIDGAYKGYDVSAPYGWTWDTTALSNGAHSIRVQAIDTSGNASADATANVVVSN
jgi:hypothetical protein